MKIYNRMLQILFFISLASACVIAQPGGEVIETPEQRAEDVAGLVYMFSTLSMTDDSAGEDPLGGTREDLPWHPVNVRYWTSYGDSERVSRDYVEPEWVRLSRVWEELEPVIGNNFDDVPKSGCLFAEAETEKAASRSVYRGKRTMTIGALALIGGCSLEELGRRWYCSRRRVYSGIRPVRSS